MTHDNQWMQDMELKSIPIFKLEFLQEMLFESKKHTGKELFPFFMSLAAKSRSQNIQFSQQELDTIIPVLKKYASEDELKKMNHAITMFNRRHT